MASQVLLKMPVTYNSVTIGKKGAEPTVRAEPVHLSCMSSEPLMRINQLEQNINFLQEQHQLMLASLHQEIEALRLRNRDLQFQLIFGSAGVKVVQSSSESSPDDAKPKIILSPKEVNNRSLQVEMLEKEVSELKASLAEANSKNTRLLQLVDHQKKQLEAPVKEGNEQESVNRLEDAENLIKKLVKENEEQRKEIHSIRSQLNKGGGNGRYSGGRRGGGGGGEHHRFPPLQTQNFWGNGSQKHKTSPEYHGGRRPLDHEVVGQAAPTLPHLNRSYSQSSSNQRHKYYSNGNHFYRGNSSEEGDGRRRYRGRGGGGSGGGHHKEEN
ncbi:keratin, type II cytoskeletal 1-like isoform X2 [Cimex lectularius]|uniref:CCDC92/74 N-terminal domain-containing protein n=1 Tax=Cimex lectularius TaxID=79782 RepID=A0A8I6RU01_CIMLE|nr:keratin, type II cytoskeletal 1-like isoform X2 [Cimex lectularius]